MPRPLRLPAALFAALALAAPAHASQLTAPVPSITVYPGETIKETVLVERTFPASARDLPVIVDRGALVGKVARRTLLPGQLVPTSAVQDPKVVIRGEAVPLVFEADGVVITTVATPLESGGIGDRVRARNVDSGLVVVGIVSSDGALRVGAR